MHHPEYTMLEWYRTNADYLDILHDTENLITTLVSHAAGACQFPVAPWPRFTVEELYLKYAGWNPVTSYHAERFEHDLITLIEPALPRDTPVFVMDYPAAAAALSRRKPGNESVAERFELYINGIEITNAFSELTDPDEQRRRFEHCAQERKALGTPTYPLDEAFLSALELGMPPSGGIALGIDRLVMVLLGATSLDEVIAFRERI